MQFNVENLCETNLDLRSYIGKYRVVLMYGNRNHTLEVDYIDMDTKC